MAGELTTTNYGWVKPTVGASVDAWGGYINTDLDGIDTTVKGVSNVANAALPLTGAVMTGLNDNRLINGDMRIDQRWNGSSSTAGSYTVDRWYYGPTLASKGTWGRNLNAVIGPAGFPYYLGFQSSSAYTPLAGDTFQFYQSIEADMVSDFAWGTANAQPVTFSFWARSSLTGTFGGAVQNYAGTRSYPFSYSLPAANTWTKIIVTVSADTAGTWVMSGNGGALYLIFDLGSGATFRGPANAWAAANYGSVTGSNNVVATLNATFYVTGVKLEIGSVATPYNRQSVAKSLADCQRYYSTKSGLSLLLSVGSASQLFGCPVALPITMRANPTIAFVSPTYSNASGITAGNISPDNVFVYATATGSGGAQWSAGTLTASAEL